jgi:hypothetical protein
MNNPKQAHLLAAIAWISVFFEAWLLILRRIESDWLSWIFFVFFFVVAVLASAMASARREK